MYNTDIFHAFKTRVDQFRDRNAIVFGSHQITYARLLDGVERLANGLRKLGVSQGDNFALMLPNLPQFIISYYALLRIGATVVPINTNYDEQKLSKVLESSAVRGIIALERFSQRLEKAMSEVPQSEILIYLGENIPSGAISLTQLIADSQRQPEDCEASSKSSALISYTAGSEGLPKGVKFTHENVMAQVYSTRHTLALAPAHTVVCLRPLFHSFGHILNVAALTSGATIVLFTKFDSTQVVDSLNAFSNIVLFASPAQFRKLIQINTEKISTENIVISVCAGGFLSDRLRKEFASRFGHPILNSYGLTEAGPLLTLENYPGEDGDNTVGLPSFGIHIKIVDSEKKEIITGGVGEILIQAANVMKSYAKADEGEGDAFSDGWLRTGDLGRFGQDGQLHFLGRKLDVIFKGGFEVYPHEVERVLAVHSKIKECRVMGIKDEALGEDLKALVVPNNRSSISVKELSRYCNKRLPAYKCPKYIEIVDSLN